MEPLDHHRCVPPRTQDRLLANSLEIGGTVGLTTAGTGGSANNPPTSGVTSALGYFAQPIDYDIDRYDLTAAYGNQRFQVQVGYTFSNFKDNLTEFDAQNPFNLNPTTTFGTSAASLSAPYRCRRRIRHIRSS